MTDEEKQMRKAQLIREIVLELLKKQAGNNYSLKYKR